MNFRNIFDLNAYAKYFKVGRLADDLKQQESLYNSQGVSQEQIDLGMVSPFSPNYNPNHGGYVENGITSINIQFDQYFNDKSQKIATYREMARYPEISDAIDNICDDAMAESAKGVMLELEIKEELPTHIEDEVKKQWKYLINDVFSINTMVWDLFRKWLVDGELYIELILNSEGDDIIGIKVLPSHTMTPIYTDNIITGYAQSTNVSNIDGDNKLQIGGNTILFDKDQIVYINYGDIGRNRYDIRGFLDSSIRTYNQLKNLEDAVVIYRLVRAPERRVWNINVGRMPKAKSDEYMRGVMQRYRKRIKYDSNTGAMDSAGNIQAMVEDFWFPKTEDGEATSVSVLGAGQNLGEMQDVEYFLKKLYKTLKLPSSRWKDVDSGTNMFSTGKSGEITREEIQFSNFIRRLQKKFSPLFLDSFITLLRLRGVVDNRYINESLYNIKYVEQNEYKEYKDLELLESRFALLGSIESYIYKPEENENGYFSREFVLRNWFMMTDDEYNRNKNLLESEKNMTNQKKLGFTDDESNSFGDTSKNDNTEFGAPDEIDNNEEPENSNNEVNVDKTPPEEFNVGAEESFKITNDNNLLKEFVNMDKYIISKNKKHIQKKRR